MSKHLKIKVCGMRDATNIEAISKLGIDWLGFIFYKKSKRFVEKDIPNLKKVESLGIQKVGVFVNEEIPNVLEKVGEYQLDYIQLHGEESPEYCENLKSVWPTIKIIKAFSVSEDFDFEVTKNYEPFCDYFLFDTKGKEYGGNGFQFNWNLLEKYRGLRPFFLSGGIDVDSVKAIKKLDLMLLAGVDINSKFEIEPALKDVEKVASFVQKLR